MTEAQWLACEDPQAMWEFVSVTASDRTLRLLAVAFCRCIWPQLRDPRSRTAVEVVERYADGEASEDERVDACITANAADVIGVNGDAAQAAVHAAMMSHHLYISYESAFSVLLRLLCADEKDASEQMENVIRDIFGNPFCPITFSPSWRTDTAVTLARQMYDSRNFSAMPILADALQDAGCDSAAILDHCRGPGPHVRGCWVVDLVLGKE
jgi:hypothetical protein